MDALLAWIYPNRVWIGAATLFLLAGLVLLGWRRGWSRTLRRHPRATVVGGTALIAVVLPLTWYLASPLIIRTDLEEAPPVVAGATHPTATVSPPAVPTASASSSSSAAGSVASGSAAASVTLRTKQGSFSGADDFHFARGTARLIETEPGRFTLRLEHFSVRNGPDLYVYLSPDATGYATGAVDLGRLKATDGSFNYDVPLGTRFEAIRSVAIWCRAFSVQFGVAAFDG